MRYFKFVYFALLVSFTTGCAIGNRYDYQQIDISLPVKGSGVVGLGVVENRGYVVSGNKGPDFIGLQRGGFGNPFDVTTDSGKPLVDDMSTSLTNALTRSGFTVERLTVTSQDASAVATAVNAGGYDRNIILTVNEWKTDVMMRIKLVFDLELQIMDKQGKLIASNSLKGEEVIGGGGFEGSNAETAASAFEAKIGRLFNTPEVKASLESL